MEYAGGLLHDALYGIQQEAVRACLFGATTLLLQAALRLVTGRGRVRRLSPRAARLSLAALVLLLALLALLLRTPPPPPPPTPVPPPHEALLHEAQRRVQHGVRFVRAHPLETTAAVSAIILVDALNLLVAVDRLDPLLRLLKPVAFAWRRMKSLVRWVLSHKFTP